MSADDSRRARHTRQAGGDSGGNLGPGRVSGSVPPQASPLLAEPGRLSSRRDEILLRRMIRVRARNDERAARRIVDQLVRPYVPAIEALVARRTRWLALRSCDREEISSAVLERLARDLARTQRLPGVAFGAVVRRKVKDQISDFLVARANRWRLGREDLTAPEDLPEPAAPPEPTPLEQAAAATALLHGLGPCERAIVYERYVLDLSIGEVAAGRGIQPAAVKKACTRGARKLRAVHEARERKETRESDGARECPGAHDRVARGTDDQMEPDSAKPMSTFLAPPSGIEGEGPAGKPGPADPSASPTNDQSDPHEG
ncbi:MAG: sigma-70 family RNA polymerase sigma factor [Solirubrobacteraceae bacterium]